MLETPMAAPLWGDERQAAAEAAAVADVEKLVRLGSLCASYNPHQTLADALADALEWVDGVHSLELLRLLIDAANGKSVEVAARDLIHKAATAWARQTVDAHESEDW